MLCLLLLPLLHLAWYFWDRSGSPACASLAWSWPRAHHFTSRLRPPAHHYFIRHHSTCPASGHAVGLYLLPVPGCHEHCCRACNPPSITASVALHPAHRARQTNKSRALPINILPLHQNASLPLQLRLCFHHHHPRSKPDFRMRHHFWMSCSSSHTSSPSPVHIVLTTTLDPTFLY